MLITTLLLVLPFTLANSQLIAPSPRKDSCSFIDQSTLYVLGGSAGTNTPPTPDFSIPKDSFYSLDLSVEVNATSAATTGWKTVTMLGATPVSGHTCVLLPIRVLLVFGSGMRISNPFLQAFDLKTQRWMSPPRTDVSGNKTSSLESELFGLYGHTAGLVGQYVVITGGKRDLPADGSTSSRTRTLPAEETVPKPNLDTYVLDVSVGPQWTWTRYPGINSIPGLTPSGRMFATSWVVASGSYQPPTFYMTGGLPVVTDDTAASDFDGKIIWKFDPVTGKWDRDTQRALDVSVYGMAAAVLPGTSTVYFQGGQNPTDGTFVTGLRTLDFGQNSDSVPRIVSGFAEADTGVSRHALKFINNSATLAVFGGVTKLNSASNELDFISVNPPAVSSMFNPKATVPVGPAPPSDAPTPPPPPFGVDPTTLIIILFTAPLAMLLLIICIIRHPGRASRSSKDKRSGSEKTHFDLEKGESAEKLLGNARTKPKDSALPEIPRPPMFAPSPLSAVREAIEPTHLYRSILADKRLSNKWSYPPLPGTSVANRSSTYSTGGQSNYTDDIESLLWLESRRSSFRRSKESFETDSLTSGTTRSSASFDTSRRSSASNSDSVRSSASKMLDVPASSNMRWTLSEAYVPSPLLGYPYGDARSALSTAASPEFSNHDESPSADDSERFPLVDNGTESTREELQGLQRPQPAYRVYRP